MIIVYLRQKSGNWLRLERRDPGRWIDLDDGQIFCGDVMAMVFFWSDATPMFLDKRYHPYWCNYLDLTIVNNVFRCNGFSQVFRYCISSNILDLRLLLKDTIKSLLSINFGIGSDLCVLQLEFIIFTSDKWIQDLVCNVFGFCLSCPDDRIPVSQKLFVPIF